MNAKGFLQKNMKMLIVIGISFLSLILLGGGFFIYRSLTGPEHAGKQLRQALIEANSMQLAASVDFAKLADDLARAVLAACPELAQGEEALAEMKDEAQRLLLKALSESQIKSEEKKAPRKPFEPVPFLPPDFIAQLAGALRFEAGPPPVLRTKFVHPVLEAEFNISLALERKQGQWQISRLLNADEVVAAYQQASAALRAEDEARLAEKNEKIKEQMLEHLSTLTCTVSAALLGNKSEGLMVIHVQGANPGELTVNNATFGCRVSSQSDSPLLYTQQLAMSQQIAGGGKFSESWALELDPAKPEHNKILQAGPLSCTVELLMLSLSNGKILYPHKQ